MIDRDQIRLQLFQHHGVRVDQQDPLMVHLLINDALWNQMDETLKLTLGGVETTLEGIYDRTMQEAKANGEAMITSGAKGSAQAVDQVLKAGVTRFQEEVNRSVGRIQSVQGPLNSILEQIQTYYDEMFKMYAFLIYLSAGLGVGIATGICFCIATLKGWI